MWWPRGVVIIAGGYILAAKRDVVGEKKRTGCGEGRHRVAAFGREGWGEDRVVDAATDIGYARRLSVTARRCGGRGRAWLLPRRGVPAEDRRVSLPNRCGGCEEEGY